MLPDHPKPAAAQSNEHILESTAAAAAQAAQALRNGPIGALAVAGIAVGLLLIGWLAFYFFLFMPRGPSG